MPQQSLAGLRELVARFRDFERRLRILETAPRAGNTTVSSGMFTVTDPTSGAVLVRIGQLADGSSGLEQVDPATGHTVHLAALALGMDTVAVATAETTSSASFTDLATAGPARTVTVGSTGRCLVIVSATMTLSGGGASGAQMGVDVAGPTVVAADVSRALRFESSQAGLLAASRFIPLTGLAAGTYTVTAKYAIGAGNSGTSTFADRRLTVLPY